MDWSNGKLRVLLVEDDADNAASLAMLLRLWGHEVQTVGDGPAALQAARESPPDVALLDLGLPGMSGHEVARRLQAPVQGKRPLLIAVTGFGEEKDRCKSEQAGIDLHLLKPVDPEILLRVLARFRDIVLP